MSNYLKPQNPLYHKEKDAYFYPLTTADQVIMENGSRLNTVFKNTVRKTVTLLADNWSADAPYTQIVIFSDVNLDDLNVDVHVAYTGNKESDLELNKGYSCISYVKKDGNSITFFCLKEKPAIDMPVEIVGASYNTIANVTNVIEEGVKLNFDIKAYSSETEMLADAPMENTIGVITNLISSWIFSTTEPVEPENNMIWINIGDSGNVGFNAMKENGIQIYPQIAKQYINGAWVDVIAKSYQNNAWVDWITYIYLFDNGNTPSEAGSVIVYGNSTITDGIITGLSASNATSAFTFENKLDIGNCTKLFVEIKQTSILSSTYAFSFGLSNSNALQAGSFANTGALILSDAKKTINEIFDDYRTFELDISKYSGQSMYVIGNALSAFSVKKVWLSN